MKIITAHKNPDFDAIASCVAAKKLHPDAEVFFPEIHVKSKKHFLLQSLIYHFMESRELDVDKVDTLIIVDTHSSKRLESKIFSLLGKVKIICYDHHPEGDLECYKSYLVKYGANTTQLVEKIIDRGIEIDEEEATLFMLGIYADTGRLTFTSTTPNDIKAAAFLLEKGADLETVKSLLEEALTETDIIILNELIKNKRIYEINDKRILLSFASLEEYTANVAQVVSKIMSMDKVSAAICIFRMGTTTYVIGRSSNSDIDVSKMLKEIGGGGHKQAASATIKNATLIEITERLSQIIKLELMEQIKARDIMSFPPRYVYVSDSVGKVNETMSKSGMNTLVVVSKAKGEKVEGIITRQVVNKAVYHHMDDKPVELFMNAEIRTVDVDATFWEIKKVVIDEKQRLVPVLDNGKLVGVITRTNILKFLTESIDKEKPLKLQNISSKIKSILPPDVFDWLMKIGEFSKNRGFNSYLVGGIVRDIIMGEQNLDVDIVVEGNGVLFAVEFAKEHSCKVATHERFKTATLITPSGLRIDIATAREEYYVLPGALPVVEESSIKLDLYRRDFTINALAVKLHDEFGELLDFFGGLNDIKNGKIRVLHMLSFVDDPTRMYRAVRFAARFDFEIGKQTDRLMKTAVKLGVINRVEKIRIFNEISHILDNNHVRESFEMLKKYNLIRALDSRLVIDNRILDYIEETEEIVSGCNIFCGDKRIDRKKVFLIVLEYLFRRVCSFCKSIGCDDYTFKWVRDVVKEIPVANGVLKKPKVSNLEIYTTLSKFPIEGILAIYVITKQKEKVKVYLEDLMHREPLIKGKDLIELGFKPSKLFSEIIQDIFSKQLLGEIKNKIEAISYIKEKHKYVSDNNRHS